MSPWNLHRHSVTKTITVDEKHQLGGTNLETFFFKCCTPTFAYFFVKGNYESNDWDEQVLANPIVFVWAAYKLILGRNCNEKMGLTSIILTNNIQNDLHLPCHQPWASFAMSVVVVQSPLWFCSCGRLRR